MKTATKIYHWIGVMVISITFWGCVGEPNQPKNAVLEILTPQVADPFQFRAIVTISNLAAYEIEISGQTLEQLDWGIELKGANDSLIALIPKPEIPDPAVLQAPSIRIEPNKTYSQNINRLKLNPSQMKPGKWQIRFHSQAIGITDGSPMIELLSDWQAIEILPGNPEPDIMLPETGPSISL